MRQQFIKKCSNIMSNKNYAEILNDVASNQSKGHQQFRYTGPTKCQNNYLKFHGFDVVYLLNSTISFILSFTLTRTKTNEKIC